MQNDFVIIYGAPRSGTYLLSTLLQKHFSIAIPVETHLVPVFQRHLWMFGSLGNYENRIRLLDCMYDYTRILIMRGFRFNSPEEQLRFSLLETVPFKEDIAERSNDFQSIVFNLYQKYAQIKGCDHWADKSAFYKPFDLEKISAQMNGNIKVVNLVRDGRDVALSWCKEWFGPRSLHSAAKMWAQHIQEARRWSEIARERTVTLRFEDLITNTEQELEKLGRQLNLNENPGNGDTLGVRMAKVLGSEYHHKITEKPDLNNQANWKSKMSEKDVADFETEAGPMLTYLGYECSSKVGRRKILSDWPESLRREAFERFIKALMPVILCASHRCGFPITRFFIGG
mgnify:FL=1